MGGGGWHTKPSRPWQHLFLGGGIGGIKRRCDKWGGQGGNKECFSNMKPSQVQATCGQAQATHVQISHTHTHVLVRKYLHGVCLVDGFVAWQRCPSEPQSEARVLSWGLLDCCAHDARQAPVVRKDAQQHNLHHLRSQQPLPALLYIGPEG